MQTKQNYNDLIDIRDVIINKKIPKQERIVEFIKQIKDPHHFRCGQFVVTVKYSNNKTTIEDCLRGIMT
jgi:hypothetical protein